MTDTFNSNPDFVIAESPNKPKHKSTPKVSRSHPCGKCDGTLNNLAPRIVITTFDYNKAANSSKAEPPVLGKHSTYYHESCSPLKSAGTFDKVKGLFGL